MRHLILLLLAILFAAPRLLPSRSCSAPHDVRWLRRSHEGWSVLVDGDRIAAVGPNISGPADARAVDLSRTRP